MTEQFSNGKWIPAKQLPYPPTLWEEIKCFFGLHEWRESRIYQSTVHCYRCGRRKVKGK